MRRSKKQGKNDGVGKTVETSIPARMDRLPWSRFHLLVVVALGITWILDGLEVTIIGSIAPILQRPETLDLAPEDLGLLGSGYVLGAVIGALLFGWLTDRVGRRLVFYATLIIYLSGVLLSAISWDFWSLACFRFITGFGIGGEYAAINSAIDELIPAKFRGRVDLIVNGSFWFGAILGSGAILILLDPHFFSVNVGWRLGFGIGGVLGMGILFLRHWVPESPRWLITHGHQRAAEETVTAIEKKVKNATGKRLSPAQEILKIKPRKSFGFGMVFKAMLGEHRDRSILALTLMVAQAFLFNAVFFTYALTLSAFQHVPKGESGIYILPLAIGNLMGPLCLGHLFDTVGRRRMIAGTFATSGILLVITAVLFASGALNAWGLTACFIAVFFFASAAASSAYLTASEIFPLETRALAISIFYSLGTAIGGVAAPWLFTRLIASGAPVALAGGYVGAAVLLLIAALAEVKFGIDSEGKSLESIAKPLSSV